MRSCLYKGAVMHERLRPRQHRFSYEFTSWLLDLDELPELDSSLRLFSYNRPGPFSFYERDFGPGQPTGLKLHIQALVEQQGLGQVERVCLLCQPRCLGYMFNSISTYFCYGAQDQLVAIIYEVTSTFGERHLYLLPADQPSTDPPPPLLQQVKKQLYVSPFMPMDCRYRFQVKPPAASFSVLIRQDDQKGELFRAHWSGKRQPLNGTALLRALLRPPMTLKTTLAIHWQALRLWLKGVPVVQFTKTQPYQVSLGQWQEEK
ncbi:MAG: DUF1365 family protein [Motiliproteus sp.]|jgi:DUF1365 family protein